MIPAIETERLILRAPNVADFEPYATYLASDRAEWVGGKSSRAQAWTRLTALAGQWLLRGYGRWVLDRKDGRKSIGIVGMFHPESWPEPELAWTITDTESEGHGFAYEAALAARNYAYQTLGWTTLISLIDPANTRSAALGTRLGAVPDGIHDDPEFGPLHIWRHPGPEAL